MVEDEVSPETQKIKSIVDKFRYRCFGGIGPYCPLFQGNTKRYQHGGIGQGLQEEFERRTKPVTPAYKPINKRKFYKEDAEKIGQIVISAMEKGGHYLDASTSEKWNREVSNFLRDRYKAKDRSVNIKINQDLRDELEARALLAHTNINMVLDNILLGLETEPIKAIRELRNTQW